MPILYIDTEAADLMSAAVEMLSAALQARVKRADPDKVISNSLVLQAHKLEGVIAQLAMPDPPIWAHMSQEHQHRVLLLAAALVDPKQRKDRHVHFLALRGVAMAVGYAGDGLSPEQHLAALLADHPPPKTDL